MGSKRIVIIFAFLTVAVAVFFCAVLLTGAVEIPASDVFAILFGSDPTPMSGTGPVSGSDTVNSVSADVSRIIVLEARLPMAVAALLAGAGLSVAGLLMQTTFQNPLAGPSVLGVSSGASLGVALLTFTSSCLHFASPAFQNQIASTSVVFGAILGAGAVILLLIWLSSALKSAASLLIAGLMLSYLTSSAITLLNFFAPASDVKQFAVWGMGSFSAVPSSDLPIFSLLTLLPLFGSLLLVKPLDSLLLGERYAASAGFDVGRVRIWLLVVSGLLTAVVTAWCGPVGFIGLVVPHIARMLTRTSGHLRLLPATMLCGAATALFCAWVSVMPTRLGVIPINAITPIIGVPVILYLLIRKKPSL